MIKDDLHNFLHHTRGKLRTGTNYEQIWGELTFCRGCCGTIYERNPVEMPSLKNTIPEIPPVVKSISVAEVTIVLESFKVARLQA